MLVGNKGYLGKAFAQILEVMDIRLITKARRKMAPAEHTEVEKALLKKRGIVETVYGQLKDEFELKHTRHRSMSGVLLNVNKDSDKLRREELTLNVRVTGLTCHDY